MSGTSVNRVREILHVAEVGQALYLLLIDYEEGDSGNAVGYVYRTSGARKNAPEPVLATNDTLRSMWASPSGALWAASADGNVSTTAKVSWPPPRVKGLDYQSLDPSMPWTVTTLPSLHGRGIDPNVTALWGTGDSDVYAGTYTGHIYHWDGAFWAEVLEDPAGAINAIGGSGPDDVFAVGFDSTILHFDGTTWRRMRNPGDLSGNEVFGGLQSTKNGETLICSHSGRVLHGSAAGFAVLGQYDAPLFGMGTIGDRLLFAAGPKGVAELKGNSLSIIKASFQPVAIIEGKARLFFIEAAQDPTAYIEYDPSQADAPWWRVTY